MKRKNHGSEQSIKVRHFGRAVELSCAGLLAAGLLTGCSGVANLSTAVAGSTATAPAVVTVSDAPLGNLLSAVVSLSAISLSTGSGSTGVSLLSKPVTVELSGLGAVQEPIELTTIPVGTYTSATLAVSSAQVTYVDTSGQAVTASAALPQPTVTVALSPALIVSSGGEIHLDLGFNLAQSFSLSGTAVTFIPALNTLAGSVSGESEGERSIELTGQVVSVSATSITVQSGDSGRQFTFAINSATVVGSGASTLPIQAGAIVQIEGQTQSDGSMLAVTITPESNGSSGGQQEDGAKGTVVSITQGSPGVVTGFVMVPRVSFGSASTVSTMVNVTLGSATVYAVPEDAIQAGLATDSFNASEIFAGQSVTVTGATDSSGNLNANRVILAQESVAGTIAATPQASGAGFVFGLTLPAGTYITTYNIPGTLNTTTNSQTEYDNGLSAAQFGTLAAGTSIEMHGFLLADSTGSMVVNATRVAAVVAPETPESGDHLSGAGLPGAK